MEYQRFLKIPIDIFEEEFAKDPQAFTLYIFLLAQLAHHMLDQNGNYKLRPYVEVVMDLTRLHNYGAVKVYGSEIPTEKTFNDVLGTITFSKEEFENALEKLYKLNKISIDLSDADQEKYHIILKFWSRYF